MTMLVWKNKLSVGNAAIDSEHKNLMELVNEIELKIKAGDASGLPHELEHLRHWLCVHFANEENIARAIGFPLAQNMREHEYLLKEFQKMENELLGENGLGSGKPAKRYSHFLSDWLTDHILKEDLLMKPMLRTYPYDFKPD